MNSTHKKVGIALLVVALFAIAFTLRAYKIDSIPGGVYPDEAVNGEDAIRANETGNYQWFYPANQGREGLFMNLIAFSFKYFGISVFTLKMWAMIASALTALGAYLLTAELFRSRKAGLIAMFLVTFSFWSINFGRISFRANLLPCILIFTFYFIMRGFHSKKYIHFILAGLIFGLGMHTYIAFRIAPLILLALLAAGMIIEKHFIKTFWKHLLLFTIGALITAAPIFYTFYTHPEFSESRSSSISVLSPSVNKGNLPYTLGRSIFLSFVKYNFWGDQNWRHNYPPYPVLQPIVGILFLLGFIYSAAKFFHLLYLRFKRDVRDEKLLVYTLLLSWFFVMHIPEFMTAEGLPHALRSIGALPVVHIFAAIPLFWFLGRIEKFGPIHRSSMALLVIVILMVIAIFDTTKYFFFWANNPKQQQSFSANLMQIVQYIKLQPLDTQKIMITGNMERVPIRVFDHDIPNITFMSQQEAEKLDISDNSKEYVLIFSANDYGLINTFRYQYPDIEFTEHKDRYQNTYFTLRKMATSNHKTE